MTPLRVALCGLAPAAAARFRDWLEAHPAMGLQVTVAVSDIDALLEQLAASPSHAVVLDAGLGLEGISLAQDLTAAHYAVLCAASGAVPPLVRRRAAELGIAHCPDADPARLAAMLRHLLGLAPGAPATGKIIAFHSPRGGAGTSSLLLHLARELRDRGSRVAVVELGSGGGAVPLLGVRQAGGWAELCGLSPEALAGDPEGPGRIAGALVEAEPGIHLMPSAGPAAMDDLSPELVEAVLRLLGPCGCAYALVDTPAEMTVRTAAAMAAADAVCLVGLPDAVSAYRLVQVEALLGELQVPPGRVRLVLNRVREQLPLPVEEALGFLPYRPALRIPEEPRSSGDGTGRSAGFKPGGPAARALDRLLEALVEEVKGP
jgi:cellulose biosynthesis protein BcsQ